MKRKQKQKFQSTAEIKTSADLAADYRTLLSREEYEKLLIELNQPLLPSFRVNPLKTAPDFPARLSAKYGWQLEPVPFCPSGFRVLNASSSEVSATLEHYLGMYYIQEAASMLPVELFSPPFNPDELILDMAASPGGKTTHLISRSADHALVVANDSSQGRLQALRIVLQNWGALNYAITRFPAEHFGKWFPGVFDRVLLDAPCSMQGLRIAESHSIRPVTAKESTQLSRRQQAMLLSALQALRVGGEVVYSTCTLLPDEDEAVIDALLREVGGAVELLDAQVNLPVPAPGLSQNEHQAYLPGMKKTIRLWPHRYHTAGFFACHLRKVALMESTQENPPYRPLEKVSFNPFTHREEIDFCQHFEDAYGYDLGSDLSQNRRLLVRHFEQVFIFPELLMTKFPGFPLQAAGMLLGEETAEGFLPSHEWVGRFGKLCQRNTLRLDHAAGMAWLEGGSLEMAPGVEKPLGKYPIILSDEGYPIGRGKLTGNGLKNLLTHRRA